MKPKDDLLTIAEFAEMAGVSKQSVYKRLNNQLKEYCQLVSTKKMLKHQALKDIYGIEVEKTVNLFNQGINPDSDIIEFLKSQMKALEEQLCVKDQQIAESNERVKELTAALRAEQTLHAESKGMIDTPKRLEDGENKRQGFWHRLLSRSKDE